MRALRQSNPRIRDIQAEVEQNDIHRLDILVNGYASGSKVTRLVKDVIRLLNRLYEIMSHFECILYKKQSLQKNFNKNKSFFRFICDDF